MKMAKASERDMKAAIEVMQILQNVDSGYYPGKSAQADEDEPIFFDDEDAEHLRLFYDRVKGCMDRAPGFVGRVIGGFHTLMHNDLVDPDQDCLALHPRFQSALDEVEQLRQENLEARRMVWALVKAAGGEIRIPPRVMVEVGGDGTLDSFDDSGDGCKVLRCSGGGGG